MITLFDRSFALASAIFVSGIIIFVLVVRDFHDTLPILPRLEPTSTGVPILGPTSQRLPEMFAPAALAGLAPITNLPGPFATTFFQPPVRSATAVASNATVKIKLTYNGFFETANGEKRAYVSVGDTLKVLPLGSAVAGDLLISNILRGELLLRRAVTQEVVVPFRGSKEVEVPAR